MDEVEFRAAIKKEVFVEVKQKIEKAAVSHDKLALLYPGGPDRIKAEALRRFSEVFLLVI